MDLALIYMDGKLSDTVQPCDTTQVRSDSDFGAKTATVQVYGNNHKSQSDRWIGIIFDVDSQIGRAHV